MVRRINAWRVVCRLSVLELSKRAGLSRPTVTALLHGSAKISIENVQKVLAALDAAAQPKKLSIEEVVKEKDRLIQRGGDEFSISRKGRIFNEF